MLQERKFSVALSNENFRLLQLGASLRSSSCRSVAIPFVCVEWSRPVHQRRLRSPTQYSCPASARRTHETVGRSYIFVPLTPALSPGERENCPLSFVHATEFAKPSQGTFEKFLLAFASIDAP